MWAPDFSSARNDASRPVRRSGLVTAADSRAPRRSDTQCDPRHGPAGPAPLSQRVRSKPIEEVRVRTRLLASALALTTPLMAAGPAHAGAVKKKRLHVRVGRTIVVVGSAPRPVAALEVRRAGSWRTIDRDRTTASGRYVLRERMRRPLSAPARVVAAGDTTRLGRVNAYRVTTASWYGPGLYGNRLSCGGRLTPRRLRGPPKAPPPRGPPA